MTDETDWAELGARCWAIDRSGAELARPSADDGRGDLSVCCEDDVAHVDLDTEHLILYGCPRFFRRVREDLAAAWHPSFLKPHFASTSNSTAAVIWRAMP